jgi:hypothetical protein
MISSEKIIINYKDVDPDMYYSFDADFLSFRDCLTRPRAYIEYLDI